MWFAIGFGTCGSPMRRLSEIGGSALKFTLSSVLIVETNGGNPARVSRGKYLFGVRPRRVYWDKKRDRRDTSEHIRLTAI
jgi:hypothetical protein